MPNILELNSANLCKLLLNNEYKYYELPYMQSLVLCDSTDEAVSFVRNLYTELVKSGENAGLIKEYVHASETGYFFVSDNEYIECDRAVQLSNGYKIYAVDKAKFKDEGLRYPRYDYMFVKGSMYFPEYLLKDLKIKLIDEDGSCGKDPLDEFLESFALNEGV